MKLLAAIILLGIVPVVNAGTLGPNIIANPGFEGENNGFPSGWQNYNNGAKLTMDNLDEANGKRAVAIVGTGELCGIRQNVRVKTNAKYKIEVSVFLDGFTAGKVIPIYITAIKKGGGTGYYELVKIQPKDVRNVDDWKTCSVVLDMNKIVDAQGDICVWAIVSGDFKGCAYFDNFTMKEIIE